VATSAAFWLKHHRLLVRSISNAFLGGPC
jgi:hypothetical protein